MGGRVLRLRVFVTHNVKFFKLEGTVETKSDEIGCVELGFLYVGVEDVKHNRVIWNNSGKIVFEGRAKIGFGTKISNSGQIVFGDGFVVTSNRTFIIMHSICFGNANFVS